MYFMGCRADGSDSLFSVNIIFQLRPFAWTFNYFQHHPLTTPLDANRPIAPIAPILPSLLFAPIFHVPLATLIPLCLRKLTQTALLPHPLLILPTPLAQPLPHPLPPPLRPKRNMLLMSLLVRFNFVLCIPHIYNLI